MTLMICKERKNRKKIGRIKQMKSCIFYFLLFFLLPRFIQKKIDRGKLGKKIYKEDKEYKI